MSDRRPPFKVEDFANDIWRCGGALKGGEINFLAQIPRWYNTPAGRRILLFKLDDNDDGGEYFTTMGVVPLQKSRDIRAILQFGGMISIAVDHIEAKPVPVMTHPDAALHLVVGTLTSLVPGGEAMMNFDFNNPVVAKKIGYALPPMNAFYALTFNAQREPVMSQVLCLSDDAGPVSRAEKNRRILAWSAEHPEIEIETSTLDGAHAASTMQTWLRGR